MWTSALRTRPTARWTLMAWVSNTLRKWIDMKYYATILLAVVKVKSWIWGVLRNRKNSLRTKFPGYLFVWVFLGCFFFVENFNTIYGWHPFIGVAPNGHTLGPTPFPFPTSDIWWWSPETCSNLFIWGLCPPPLPKQHLVVATEAEAQTVSKWAVCILLECCLIYSSLCCLI